MIRDLIYGFWCLGYFLVAVGLLSALARRGTSRSEQTGSLLLLFFALLAPLVLRTEVIWGVETAGAMGYSLVAFALFRVVGQFRTVPRLLTVASVFAPAGVLAGVLVPGMRLASIVAGMGAILNGSAAVLFFGEARSARSIRRRRLLLAGAGSLLAPAGYLAFLAVRQLAWKVQAVTPWQQLAEGISFVFLYIAFTPPKWLFRRWQRVEQDAYLRDGANRDSEERGRRAPGDLFDATRRAVGGTLTLVALRPLPGGDDLTVSESSEPSLRAVVVPRVGLVARLLDDRLSYSGSVECDWDLAPQLRGHGESLFVTPIVADGQTWGIVAVVHHRGALFPEADLELLEQLARSTAVALDHAALILDRRERERAEADRRFRELETRVDLMLESIKDYGMFVLNVAGHVASWQPGARHLFGHRGQDICGQSAAGLFRVTHESFLQWLAEACASGLAERECTCARADGTTFVGVTTIRPLIGDVPGLGGFVAVTHDVTNRRALEERVRQGQKMEAIGRLAGGIAHDFNNLLAVIMGHADWLERELGKNGPREEVEGIQQATERAADLTRRLLAFSRRSTIEPARVNLSVLVRDMLPMLNRLLVDQQIQVVDGMSSTLPFITADHSQLQQVVMNLIVNARDAMPHGGSLTVRTAEVWLESGTGTGPTGRHVLLEVADTGIGMDAETRRLAFEPFFTTKDVGKGTGLGLSTVYGIVQQLGGRIQLESEVDRGTTVRLYLPEASNVEASTPTVSLESLIGPDTLM